MEFYSVQKRIADAQQIQNNYLKNVKETLKFKLL